MQGRSGEFQKMRANRIGGVLMAITARKRLTVAGNVSANRGWKLASGRPASDAGSGRSLNCETSLKRPGKFLLVEGEEISDAFQGKICPYLRLNLANPIACQGGTSVADTIARNFAGGCRAGPTSATPNAGHCGPPKLSVRSRARRTWRGSRQCGSLRLAAAGPGRTVLEHQTRATPGHPQHRENVGHCQHDSHRTNEGAAPIRRCLR